MSGPNTGPAWARTRVSVITLFGVLAVGFGVVAVLLSGETSASSPAWRMSNTTDPNDVCGQLVPSPNHATPNGYLSAVDALSASDVWAVGHHYNGGQQRTLVEHWNGAAWSVVPSPDPSMYGNTLFGVAALSANDVWAVGAYDPGTAGYQTLVMRWNGTLWSLVESPNPGAYSNSLYGVDAVSTNDVWAVGTYSSESGSHTLTTRWNGSTWSVVSSPGTGTLANYLLGVAASSTNDVWAVGYYNDGDRNRTLVEHWDGSTWTQVPSPNPPGGYYAQLNAVAAVSASDVWAVGDNWSDTAANLTLVVRYLPCLFSTPTPTGIPATPTPTPAPPTATSIPPSATATPAPCAITFTDVPIDHTFYPFIRCLACRGILGGYNDGTFRPNTPVTRGQLSKIVSNSAGFNEPPGAQMFEDVPPGSTFYEWVQRLASRGHINGYACGGPSEPCGTGNLPYFRPGAGATRGQLAKIVSNAAGFNDTIPPGQYTFADVPPAHTFWVFVERLLLNRPDVMAGYPCGGVGEPCDTESRPYFRPNNPLTRGQTSKIVANTFFPNCNPPRP